MTQRSRGGFLKFGGDGGIRTLDLSDANRTLSQLSYAPTRLIYYSTFFAFVKPIFSVPAIFLCKKSRARKLHPPLAQLPLL